MSGSGVGIYNLEIQSFKEISKWPEVRRSESFQKPGVKEPLAKTECQSHELQNHTPLFWTCM